LCATVAFSTPKNPKLGDKMKTLKVICAATVLALSLSVPAYATDPGEIHDPGKAPCVLELPESDTGSTKLTTTVDSDFSLLAVVNMLWTVASIF
jgi:hypothetical protein